MARWIFAIYTIYSLIATKPCRPMKSSSFLGQRLRVLVSLSDVTTAARYPSRRGYRQSSLVMMPEGPEVRRLVDQLQGGVGQRFVDLHLHSGRYVQNGSPDGWQAFSKTLTPVDPSSHGEMDEADSRVGDKNQIENKKAVDVISKWECKGKFIFIQLTDLAGYHDDFLQSIWITLGMTGRFLSQKAHDELDDQRHFRWCLELANVSNTSDRTRIYYYDARNFGTVKFCQSRQLLVEKLQSLGPDILKDSTTEDDFVNLVAIQTGRKREAMNVCRFLMDQSKISGIGNYLLAEGLYRADIDPFASLSELSDVQQRTLFRQLQSTARHSYRTGVPSNAIQNAAIPPDNDNDGPFELQCYGRERCIRGDPVQRETQGPHGRKIWYTDRQLFMPRSQRWDKMAEILELGKRRQPLESSRDKKKKSSLVDGTPGKKRTASTEGAVVANLAECLTEPSWKEALSDVLESNTFREIALFLEEERLGGQTVFPPRDQIFTALNLCPFHDVKVVIVGQDPYHGYGQAHGLAFSVLDRVEAPRSLQNIIAEAMEDVGIEAPCHGNLEHWAKQGVLLINTVLTVREAQPNSHADRGWEEFTDAIIQQLAERHRSDGNALVFLLWGNPAHKKGSVVDSRVHKIIKTSHPSPLSARKTDFPFLGSRCFSRANQALRGMGLDPIDWNIDNEDYYSLT